MTSGQMASHLPIALTCGEPAGIGPELAVAARLMLGNTLPFFWIGDPRHLPPGTAFRDITSPAQALSVPANILPVLPHAFAATNTPGASFRQALT